MRVHTNSDYRNIISMTIFCILILSFYSYSKAHAQIKQHAIIYGGLSDSLIPDISKNFDILIVGDIRKNQLMRMKQINPKIIILKYHHSIGMHKSYGDWRYVDTKDEWFAHDKLSGKRIIEKQYGWYLMNITNHEWLKYQAKKISEIDAIYDGVFLDDYWDSYNNKFKCIGTSDSPVPEYNLSTDWKRGMLLLMQNIKKVYPKRVFINGAHSIYLMNADGCMEESFIHSSWNSDSIFRDSSSYIRSLINIFNMSSHKKYILVQSGTKSDSSTNKREIYNYCLASYFLVENEYTSFYFQPQESATLKNISFGMKINIGKPKNNYYSFYEQKSDSNLISNGNFRNQLERWKIVTGRPFVYADKDLNADSVELSGNNEFRDYIQSELIPIKESTKYTLSAWCKSAQNNPGSEQYHKLGIEGSFYDKNKKFIRAGYGLQFDEGEYDWQPYEITHLAPKDAAFFQIGIGFLGNGHGHGAVTNVAFSEAKPVAKIFRRDFEHGSVMVNCGSKDVIVNTNIPGIGEKLIKTHQGLILEY